MLNILTKRTFNKMLEPDKPIGVPRKLLRVQAVLPGSATQTDMDSPWSYSPQAGGLLDLNTYHDGIPKPGNVRGWLYLPPGFRFQADPFVNGGEENWSSDPASALLGWIGP